MPVILKVKYQQGWKAKENKRFGLALIYEFVDVSTNTVLFEYAPTLEDLLFLNHTLPLVIKLDQQNKEMLEAEKAVGHLKETKGCGK